MKTWPTPWNPEHLPDPEPGYRYLGKDEPRRPDDETMDRSHQDWLKYGDTCALDKDRWTIRRALSVDDEYAPPPDQWVIPGWEVFTEPTLDSMFWDPKDMSWHPRHTHADLTHLERGCYYRRPIVSQPSMNTTSSAPAKPVLKPGQRIVIKVGDSKPLAQAVVLIVPKPDTTPNGRNGHVGSILIQNGEIQGSSKDVDYYRNSRCYSDAIFLDARTDLGVLIDLLAAPVINPPKIDGSDGKTYEGKYTKGADIIEFGCAKISINLLECAKAIMDKAQPGNRTIQSIGLSSGVPINREEIGEILTYVEAINKG